MFSHTVVIKAVLLALATVCALGAAGCAPERAGGPNIILITMDTFRADRMAPYGGEGLTPTLDALAEKGTVFTHAVVSAGTTFPSHATMFTGLNPRRHGVRSNYSTLPDDVPTLAEALVGAGYDAGAFVSFKSMLVQGNLGKGFTALSDVEAAIEPFRNGDETAKLAMQWLDSLEGQEQPIFLWYHNFDAHLPLRLTDYAKPRLEALGYAGPWGDGASIEEVTSMQKEIGRSEYLQAAIGALYDGEVINADNAVAELLEGLDQRGLLDDSVIVIVADHGEALGEHGWFGHGATLWEPVIRTPMVIVDSRNPQHREVDTTVGTIDLMATLLDLAGVDSDTGQGRSLLPSLNGLDVEPREYVVEIEWRRQESRPQWYDPDRLAVYHEGYKYEYAFGTGRLFDLEADPDAASPLRSPDQAQATIENYLNGLAQQVIEGQGVASPSTLDEASIKQLRALGYVQ